MVGRDGHKSGVIRIFFSARETMEQLIFVLPLSVMWVMSQAISLNSLPSLISFVLSMSPPN